MKTGSEDFVVDELVRFLYKALGDGFSVDVGGGSTLIGPWRPDVIVEPDGRDPRFRTGVALAIECKGHNGHVNRGSGQALSYRYGFPGAEAGVACYQMSRHEKGFVESLPLYGFDVRKSGVTIESSPSDADDIWSTASTDVARTTGG